MKKLVFLVLAISLSGCSLLNSIQGKSTDKIADLIEKYCSETDESFREQFRTEINQKLGNKASVKVECN